VGPGARGLCETTNPLRDGAHWADMVGAGATEQSELWGRFLTCGGLSIRLPPLDAPPRPRSQSGGVLREGDPDANKANPPEAGRRRMNCRRGPYERLGQMCGTKPIPFSDSMAKRQTPSVSV